MSRGITDFLIKHTKEDPVWFHMPGHKGERLYRENGYGVFLDHIMNCDITEISGADNLFQPEDSLLKTMNRYKKIYGSKGSYLLINGSSAGIISGIMATVHRGGTLIMARNCHKSVFNGLRLAGANPAYVYPEVIEDFNISGEIRVDEIKRALVENPEAEAVMITSPNYYGICSDIKAISEEVHKAGKVLIVDQAHGAHLALFDKYINEDALSAEAFGADIVINSTHKTLASYTQSAVVNLCSDRVDKYIFEDKLQMIESTSPSYLLMASLDINADLIENRGESLIKEWKQNLQYFYKEAEKIPGLKVLTYPRLDYTKLNLDMSAYGIDGLMLEELLMEEGIYIELVTGNILMCMTGIGNRRCDYERLLQSLERIAKTHSLIVENKVKEKQLIAMKKLEQREIPEKQERIPLEKAAGRVCAFSIIPYPPGIPIICPGEIMDEEVLEYVKDLRTKGEKVMGIDEKGRVVVGR